ncbi:MAG: YggS family pyridoxal phosphate-dependent enzyme [Treponema sp.]|jgi:pyridoxal phosphate enzyme (YggS family)|nr:YggS family pyridoxal phosphate-dependent enzyme [Treponema sp.]
MSISNNYKQILDSIKKIEKNANRSSGSVKLLVVSKFHSVEEIEEAIKAGANLFGENRAQEAAEKFPALLEKYPSIELHFIGSLQRNKVKQIVPIVSCIQSVDRIELIEEIEKQCAKINKRIKILFESHTAEDSKSGFRSIESLKEAMNYLSKCSHIIPAGFMTMAPFTEDKNMIEASFKKLVSIAETMKNLFPNFDLSELSMGMSNDFETAINCGSTLVRIGTAIFGERKKG